MRNHQADAYGEPNPPEEVSIASGEEESEDEVMIPLGPPPKKAKVSKQTVSNFVLYFYHFIKIGTILLLDFVVCTWSFE